MNTLTTPFLTASMTDGSCLLLTLPGAIAALMRDEVASFPALRPHQRHAWHAFLAQLGTVALLRAGLTGPPTDENAWRDLLRALTPDDLDDVPWCLVSSPDRPALLQAPVPDGMQALQNRVETPDGLDMLVSARNHELKQAIIGKAEFEDWFFALLTLQTMEGYLGAGNFGISRMNGGFANRPAVGIVPPGGTGAHVRRDILRLLEMQGRPPHANDYALAAGLALLWLRPWSGTEPLARDQLDPLYIEVCRRVRLVEAGGRLHAMAGSSKATRVMTAPGGMTGDPWSPVRAEKDGTPKVLTVDARGFGYQQMVDLLFAPEVGQAPLQRVVEADGDQDLMLLARALVRGQGKTEGWHERRVPLSRVITRMQRDRATDPAAQMARDRVELAGEMARALRFALLALFENGPDKVDEKANGPDRKARPFVTRFEAGVDRNFFPALWRELEAITPEAQAAERTTWVRGLLNQAETMLDAADVAAPKAVRRRYRARVRARAALHGRIRSEKGKLRPHLLTHAEAVPDAA